MDLILLKQLKFLFRFLCQTDLWSPGLWKCSSLLWRGCYYTECILPGSHQLTYSSMNPPLGQSPPQYYRSRQTVCLLCHYVILLLFALSESNGLRFQYVLLCSSALAVVVWHTAMVFVCLLLFSLSFVFTVSLNNPFGWKKITHNLMPIRFYLCHFMFPYDHRWCTG